MTGSLLGAVLGTEWLGIYGRTVQDRALLVDLAECLLTSPEKTRTPPPTHEQALRARTLFTKHISDAAGIPRVLQLPDRRSAQVGPATSGESADQWLVAVTDDGQTLHLRRPESRQPALFDVDSGPAPTQAEQPHSPAHSPQAKAQLQGAYLKVADTKHVRHALLHFFGLSPERHGPTWASYGNLVLAQDHAPATATAGPLAQLRVTVPDPLSTQRLLTGRDLKVTSDENTGTFRVQIDPYLTVVFAADSDRRAPRWDAGF